MRKDIRLLNALLMFDVIIPYSNVRFVLMKFIHVAMNFLLKVLVDKAKQDICVFRLYTQKHRTSRIK